jgi:TetR/AcrR family transcriptional regulator, tetracycline repressor protein
VTVRSCAIAASLSKEVVWRLAGDVVKAKQRLSVAVIVECALTLLDEKGFDGVSTRAIAERLGVKSASLYWHIKNKQELLNHMAAAMLMAHLPKKHAADQSWQDWLAAGAHCIRNAALSRRDGAKVIAARQPSEGPGPLSFPAMLERLLQAGFTRTQALNAFLVLNRYTIGWVLAEQIEGSATKRRRSEGVGYEFGLSIILRGLEDSLSG